MATKLKTKITRVGGLPLNGFYGADRGRRLVISLIPGNGLDVDDLIEIRPAKTRRPETVTVADVYAFALKARINRGVMEKLREKKAKKAAAKAGRAWKREIRKPLEVQS